MQSFRPSSLLSLEVCIDGVRFLLFLLVPPAHSFTWNHSSNGKFLSYSLIANGTCPCSLLSLVNRERQCSTLLVPHSQFSRIYGQNWRNSKRRVLQPEVNELEKEERESESWGSEKQRGWWSQNRKTGSQTQTKSTDYFTHRGNREYIDFVCCRTMYHTQPFDTSHGPRVSCLFSGPVLHHLLATRRGGGSGG